MLINLMLENDMSDSKSASISVSASAATTFVPFNNMTNASKDFVKGRAQTLSEDLDAKFESDLKDAVNAYHPNEFGWGEYNNMLAYLIAARVKGLTSPQVSLSEAETTWINTAAEEVTKAKNASEKEEEGDENSESENEEGCDKVFDFEPPDRLSKVKH